MNSKVPLYSNELKWLDLKYGINTAVPAKWVIIGLSNDMLFIQHHSVT